MTTRKKITNNRGSINNQNALNNSSTRNNNNGNSNNSSNKRKLYEIDLEIDNDDYNYEEVVSDTSKNKNEDFAKLESLVLGNNFFFYLFTIFIYHIYLIIDKFYNNRNW
jgi:hypothetical protein